MPFLPLFIVIGIFLAASKILQPSQQGQRRKYERSYEEYDDTSLSLALIDYISRESKGKSDFNRGRKSDSKHGKRGHKEVRRR